MKKVLIVVVFICLTTQVFSQRNLSVPLTDSVYDVIDYIEIRNYTRELHNARPYTLDLILETLYTALDHPDITLKETMFIQDTIERLQPVETMPKESESVLNSLGFLAKEGAYRYEETIDEVPITFEIGAIAEMGLVSNFNDPSISSSIQAGAYLLGDLGDNFSYKVDFSGGLAKLDYSAYAPYTFHQFWAGYQYNLEVLSQFSGLSENAVAFVQFNPEFSTSFFDNRLFINASRVQKDWGTGNGNLMLSETAQPFASVEMHLRPVDFASLSVTTGALEYSMVDSGNIKPTTFQNFFSAFMAELFIGEYAYLGLTNSVVYPKRIEFAYLIPGMLPFFTQNTMGDFDNVLLGLSFGANIPGYANFYVNAFMDELDFNSEDFFHKDRNMYSIQTGLNVVIPNTAFTVFNIQYTKLEPYMYTHPGTQTPWYSEAMETNYVNHGENIGYKLEPNSDEILISATSMPFWFLKTNLSYSLIRHGVDYGSGTVDGSNINDSHSYDYESPDHVDINTKTKYFLTDGTYEWIHTIGIQGEMDLRFVKDIPLSLVLGYAVSYKYHTEPDVLNVSFKPVNNEEYKNTWGNHLTFSVRIW